jgi:hypothetical protein
VVLIHIRFILVSTVEDHWSRQCGILNISWPYRTPPPEVRTSQETHLWAAMACYGDGFTFLYVDEVRTS